MCSFFHYLFCFCMNPSVFIESREQQFFRDQASSNSLADVPTEMDNYEDRDNLNAYFESVNSGDQLEGI